MLAQKQYLIMQTSFQIIKKAKIALLISLASINATLLLWALYLKKIIQ
jgi:hypothetical protein